MLSTGFIVLGVIAVLVSAALFLLHSFAYLLVAVLGAIFVLGGALARVLEVRRLRLHGGS